MLIKYDEMASIFKALSDPTRLKIVEMISSVEMCACEILEKVDIKQSTLSYHMKILTDIKLVDATPKGSWVWYKISNDSLELIEQFLNMVTKNSNNTIKGNKEQTRCAIND